MKASQRSMLVDVRDGKTIHAVLTDAGEGRPRIALLHSLAMDSSFWDPLTERLRSFASVLSIDVRGHGKSSPVKSMTASEAAQDLVDVMEFLDWKDVIVAGASMGGCIALQFAIDHPDRTTGLGLIDTTAWYGPDAPAAWEGRAQRARSEGFGALFEFQVTRWFSDSFRESRKDVVDECIRTFLANDMDSYMAACRMLGAFDARASLDAIDRPTAIIVGEEDYAAPVAMAKDLEQAIAGSSLTILPGARHLTPLETPDEIAAFFVQLVQCCGTGT